MAHLFSAGMQPHPPQLPTDDANRPAPKSMKKGLLFLFVIIAVTAALIAFMLPDKQVEASRAPGSPQPTTQQVQRAQTEAFKSLATK
jgi:hypothetical protein